MRDPLSPQPEQSPPILGIVRCLIGMMLAGGAWFAGTLVVKEKAAAVRRGWNLTRAKPV